MTSSLRKEKKDMIQEADVAKLTDPEMEEFVARYRKFRRVVRNRLQELGTELPEGYGQREQKRKYMRKIKSAKNYGDLITPKLETFIKGSNLRTRENMLRHTLRKAAAIGCLKEVPQGWGVLLNPKTECIQALKTATAANTMEALDAAIATAIEMELDPEKIGELEAARAAKDKLQEIEDAKKDAIEALKTAAEGDDMAAIDEAVAKAEELGLAFDLAEIKAAKQKKIDLEMAAAEAKKQEAIDALKAAAEDDDIEAIDAAIAAAAELTIDGPEMKAASSKKTTLLEAKTKAEEEAKKAEEAKAAEEAPTDEAPAEEEKPAE